MTSSSPILLIFPKFNRFSGGRSSIFHYSIRYKLKRAPRSEFYIRPDGTEPDPNVARELAQSQMPHRKHPGRLSIPAVVQPRKFERSLIKSCADLDLRSIKPEAKKLYEYLAHRQLPWTEQMFKRKFDQLLAERIEKLVEKYKAQTRAVLGASPTDEEVYEYVESQSEQLNRQVANNLRKLVYNWKPSDYKSKGKCVAYALARFAPDYAIMNRILNEIKQREPAFQPSHVFDFGSGLCSTVWAVENTWPMGARASYEARTPLVGDQDHAKSHDDDGRHATKSTDPDRRQYFCVDTSADMINLANELLKDGEPSGPLIFDHVDVYFRQFLPALQEKFYDLTVAAFSMMEIPSYDERMRVAVNLWHKTKDFLIFVENGNRYGYTTLMEIRDYLLAGGREIWRKQLHQLFAEKNMNAEWATEICSRKDLSESEKLELLRKNCDGQIKIPTIFSEGHVFAPCPHDYICPRLRDVLPCKFVQSYYDLRLTEDNPASNVERSESFIYLILRKGSRDQYDYPTTDWPRLVKPVLIRHKHVLCEMCTAHGVLSEMIATKNKNGRDVYRMVKSSDYGDLLPVKLTFDPKKQEVDEENRNLDQGNPIDVEQFLKKRDNVIGNVPNEFSNEDDDLFDGFDHVKEENDEKLSEKYE